MRGDLLNKINKVKKYIPDEILPELVVANLIVLLQRQTPSDVYVFCGSDHFDRSMFMPIANEPYPWVKPRGGMWSSPVDSENTWEE